MMFIPKHTTENSDDPREDLGSFSSCDYFSMLNVRVHRSSHPSSQNLRRDSCVFDGRDVEEFACFGKGGFS